MKLEPGDLTSEVAGQVGKDRKVLVIRSIGVVYRLRVGEEHLETAERVHGFHAEFCPVYKTLAGCVEFSTRLEIET